MNKVILMGNLTKDPELRYSSNTNMAITKFNIAIQRRAKEGEERQADYVYCTSFGKTAEFINNYFKKGNKLAVVGRIQTGSYDKDGQKVYTTDVIVDEAFFTGNKSDSESSGQSMGSEGSTPGFFPMDTSDDELPF